MMRNGLFWLAIAALLVSLPGFASAAAVPALAGSAAAQAPVKVIVTVGEEASVEIPAKLRQGQTVVPFRAFIAALGGKVSWDDRTSSANATLDGSTAAITAGASKFVFNGEAYLLSQPSWMSVGTLYVPLRSVSLAIGASIAASGSPLTVRVHYERAEQEQESLDERLAHLMQAVFERRDELMDGIGVMPLSGDVANGRVWIQIRSYGDVERKLGDAELAAVRAAMYRIAGEEFPLLLDVAECCTRDPDIVGVIEKVDTTRKVIEVSGEIRGVKNELPFSVSLYEDTKLIVDGTIVKPVFTEEMVGKTIRAWETGVRTMAYRAVKVELD